MPSQHFVPHIFFGLDPMMVSTVVPCVTYGVIIWDKLNRAIVALLGASVMVLVGALDQTEALKGIDWNTIGLLTGMMILVSISRRSGMFEYLAIWSAQKAKANRRHPAVVADHHRGRVGAARQRHDGASRGAGDACHHQGARRPALPVPVRRGVRLQYRGHDPLIGDPPNIMIGSLAGLDFNAFVIHLTPVIVVIMAVQALRSTSCGDARSKRPRRAARWSWA